MYVRCYYYLDILCAMPETSKNFVLFGNVLVNFICGCTTTVFKTETHTLTFLYINFR